jgi:DNA repair protein RadD
VSAPVLREYQVEAIDRLRSSIERGVARVLFVLATGGGKTVCFASIIASAIAKGSRVLVVAHRVELLDQCVRKLLDAGIPEREIGVIRAQDKRRRPGAAVQVASIDTLRNRAKPPADLVIVDEAHRALAASYVDLRSHYPDAVHLGFTATPVRADGKGLKDQYDDIVVAVPISQLIADGFLVAPRVWTVPAGALPDLKGVKTTAGDYNAKQLGEACNQGALLGDIVDHWERRAGGERTVGFAVNVEHSKALVRRFVERGHAAEHLDGTTPEDERRAILGRLEAGTTRIVINVGCLQEGWDQPSCKVLILARPTQSLGLYLQMAGRILRPWNGVGAVILDHAGCARMHGLPHEDRPWSLEPSKKKRSKGEMDCAKLCEECLAVVELGTRICPGCGAELPWREQNLTEGEGELEEVLEVSVRQNDEHAALVEAWREENARRMASPTGVPRKPGWVFMRWKQMHGGRPPPKGCKPPKWTPEEEARWNARNAEPGALAGTAVVRTTELQEMQLQRQMVAERAAFRAAQEAAPIGPRKLVSGW